MREGPANGLRRQHRFTRVPSGWKQSAESSGKQFEFGEHDDLEGLSSDAGENDDLDGLSEEQIRGLKRGTVEIGVPVDAQCEANDQATAWAAQWGAELDLIQEVVWPSDLGTLPSNYWSMLSSKLPSRAQLELGLGGMGSTRGLS